MRSPSLHYTQRHALADVMDEVRYSDGEYLVTMGEVADALFFIKSGEVHARV